jgi:hypothetical protein
MGNIGSHVDLTSGRQRTSSKTSDGGGSSPKLIAFRAINEPSTSREPDHFRLAGAKGISQQQWGAVFGEAAQANNFSATSAPTRSPGPSRLPGTNLMVVLPRGSPTTRPRGL